MAQIDFDTLPKSRPEARALGARFYFTGKPCKHGHVSHRYTTGPCFECVSPASSTSWAARNPEARRLALQTYGRSERNLKRSAQYREENRETLREYHATWRDGNEDYKTKRREYFNGWRNDKMANDPRYRVAKSLRDRLTSALKSKRQLKNNSTMALIGCSKAELVAHLEAQFEPGMSWGNYNWETWHIDHIRPIATFEDPQDPECWHYTNLRPRWAEENIAAGVKLRWDLAKQKGASRS
jgi:hypothetical protein